MGSDRTSRFLSRRHTVSLSLVDLVVPLLPPVDLRVSGSEVKTKDPLKVIFESPVLTYVMYIESVVLSSRET